MGVIESISLEFLGVVLVNSPLGGHKEYIFFSQCRARLGEKYFNNVKLDLLITPVNPDSDLGKKWLKHLHRNDHTPISVKQHPTERCTFYNILYI